MLVLADELEPHGGAERRRVEVAEALARRGHQISLVYARPGGFLERYQAFARTVLQVPAAQGDGTRATDLRLLAAAARGWQVARHCDVVYANSIRLSFLGATMSATSRRPLVCHLRLPDPPSPSVKTRLGTAGVDRFIAVSQHTRGRHVAAGLDPDRIDVVHNGVDTAQFRPADEQLRRAERAQLGVHDDRLVELYAGRLDAAKGIEVLLRAWGEHVRRPGAGDDLLLVAGAPREHLSPAAAQAYVASLHGSAPEGVRWLGRRLDVVPLYAAADVVVLPSLFEEPFGRVVIEGMASGRPVIASSTGGVPEILDGAFPDLLVPPGDQHALAAALGRLRRWREHDPALGQRLRRHVEGSFSVAATVAGVEQVLHAAAARGRAGDQAP